MMIICICKFAIFGSLQSSRLMRFHSEVGNENKTGGSPLIESPHQFQDWQSEGVCQVLLGSVTGHCLELLLRLSPLAGARPAPGPLGVAAPPPDGGVSGLGCVGVHGGVLGRRDEDWLTLSAPPTVRLLTDTPQLQLAHLHRLHVTSQLTTQLNN